MSRTRKAAAFLIVAILVLVTASVAFGGTHNGIYRTKPPANRTTFLDFELHGDEDEGQDGAVQLPGERWLQQRAVRRSVTRRTYIDSCRRRSTAQGKFSYL